jgi:hypothetical protein
MMPLTTSGAVRGNQMKQNDKSSNISAPEETKPAQGNPMSEDILHEFQRICEEADKDQARMEEQFGTFDEDEFEAFAEEDRGTMFETLPEMNTILENEYMM